MDCSPPTLSKLFITTAVLVSGYLAVLLLLNLVCLFVYITYTVWPCLALVNRDGLRIILKKSKPERGSGVTSPDLRRAGPENLKNDRVAIVKK